ncbi:MAG TPA: MBL fold metallo-hydrolase [Chromatiales bacterium]|nr:MBL fold metallo-hydrolase [Chromatiales bacterium]
MFFRQLFEPDSSTYTYLLGCPYTGETVLIDPVLETAERDLEVIRDLGLKPTYTLETHIHADHLTGARKLRALAGTRIVVPAMERLQCADLGVEEGVPFRVGSIEIQPLHTPGHTATHHAYLVDDGTHRLLFTGDALLIDACGRTDFQSGDPRALYRSIMQKFFTLPDETLVYPAHDYEGRRVSSIGQERRRNPRLAGKSEAEFVAIMEGLELPPPRKIEFAVPGNEQCGACPDNVPERYRGPCEITEREARTARRLGDQG